MAFTTNPLFQIAAKEIRDAARSEFARSTPGRILREAQQLRTAIRREPREHFSRLAARLKPYSGNQLVRQILGTEVGQLARDIEQYAKGGSLRKRIVESFLSALGPAGQMLRTLLGPSKRGGLGDGDIEAARRLLKAFGYEVFEPAPLRKPEGRRHRLDVAKSILEQAGYRVVPPGEEPEPRTTLPFGIPEKTSTGNTRKVVKINVGGANRQFDRGHPIVTGTMVRASSSNVHSYGYDVEHEILYIRFLAPDPQNAMQKIQAPGPLYQYRGVPPELFLRLHDATSKGNWVWDNLRIRGTISGHRYDYALVGVTGDYVPRKATLLPEGEGYVQRRVKTVSGRVLTSRGPDVVVRPMRPSGPSTVGPSALGL